MSDQIPESTPQDAPAGNPAWNDVLSIIPQEFHSQVTPHFSNWDKGVQEKIQKVHSDYQAYKAYEPFVQNNIPYEEVTQGYGLLRAIYENPQKVIEAIRQSFNLEPEVIEQGESEDVGDEQYANLPPHIMQQLQRQEQMMTTMGQILAKQREQELAAVEAKKLDNVINGLKKEHGDFNEEVVLSLAMQMNGDVVKAHKAYTDMITSELAKRSAPKAPRLISPGGSAPDNAIDPRKLNGRQTTDLVVEMLKAAQANKR